MRDTAAVETDPAAEDAPLLAASAGRRSPATAFSVVAPAPRSCVSGAIPTRAGSRLPGRATRTSAASTCTQIAACARRTARDAIVLATGFALGLATAPFPIYGLGGATLGQAREHGAVAYKGVAVAGFPNWFILTGPNTGPGHTSVVVFTEAQIAYARQAIRRMIADDLKYVNVRRDVQDTYNAGIQRRMKHMAWSSGCSS
jgi:cation diffusion facilitator CzcD-associated flavoprotein CzcO